MFNPFSFLSKPLLDAFVKSGKKYFVRQSFPRAKDHFDESIKAYFIFTQYSEIAHALHHLDAISHDPHRFLYEWDNPEHRQKLCVAADNPPCYKVYACVLNKHWQKQIQNAIREKTRGFIERNIGWKPRRNDTVKCILFVNNGELYAKLKLRAEEVRVKLEEIENINHVLRHFIQHYN